jgi:hypothetical protein
MKRRCARRHAYTLVFFAMFLFGFMALAALVIDVGFARLAQRQMQTAVDAAALEGLRFRDEDSDLERRERASQIVAWVFDDNLDPDDGDAIGFGAGPLVELTGGVGDPSINAGQLLEIPETPFYKPWRDDGMPGLELNLDNEIHGDMVAGRFDPDATRGQAADYQRDDFSTQPPEDPDNPYDAFLVRMRRTNDFQGLDGQAGISSHGPTIPYLFGRGALFPAGDPEAGYSPRHHGITVRATGIAQAQRVLSVGMPHSDLDLRGLAPFTLDLNYWNGLQTGVADSQDLTMEGEIGTVGHFYALGSANMPLVIGHPLPASAAQPDETTPAMSPSTRRFPTVRVQPTA